MLVLGRSERTVVIVGHDAHADTRSDVLGVHITDSPGETGSLVATRIDSPVTGYARAATVGPLTKGPFRQGEHLGDLDRATLEQVDIALRAALDL